MPVASRVPSPVPFRLSSHVALPWWAVVLGGLLVAPVTLGCAKSDEEGEPTSDGGTASDATTDASRADSGGGQADTGTGEAGNPCEATTTQGACTQCCSKDNQAGSDFYSATSLECVCQASVCKTQCASAYCDPAGAKSPSAGDPCATCYQNALRTLSPSGCRDTIPQVCQQDTACNTYLACTTQSRCALKP